jgi:hypothetical protein
MCPASFPESYAQKNVIVASVPEGRLEQSDVLVRTSGRGVFDKMYSAH